MLMKTIEKAILKAEKERKKSAMFHYQILINADNLKDIDALKFCKGIKIPESYAIEYRKMIKLAALMKEQGATINKP